MANSSFSGTYPSSKYLLLSLLFLFLTGCATPYKSEGILGGFSETQLSENVFKVSFRGNEYTSMERAQDFVLFRCAELSRQNGYDYFVIVDEKSYNKISQYQTPAYSTTSGSVSPFGNSLHYSENTTFSGGQTITISCPNTTNTIHCFKNKPNTSGAIYDASLICKSIGSKYNINCSI
ncbi:hypothetical protein G3N56_16800 [Desulfovibrio sulfodismutans]|uniref:Lipoprotein n=1 Tax=Desulfolutivibrio sulfodismutans TaxID=63561 RepID=A0A7K3NRH6_9BACT|nr:hypothetical protein [Desulfolutivibrio sulfodismutans]NDY58395.1 hypothetical protein [Desulfolutivibrio sulfodismutans]QLA13478.1 hypothetical protein GD606_15000 [Desulfolutivibrio sulfodismutans DSM 3696]